MIKLENMNRQHDIISTEVNLIEEEIQKDIDLINPAEVALHINRLAGLLKVHLIEEDKFLYPILLKSDDKEIQTMTKQYINEMGDLASAYTEYKNKYNVRNKISKDVDLFIRDTAEIVEALKKRIVKENNELYHLIVERNL